MSVSSVVHAGVNSGAGILEIIVIHLIDIVKKWRITLSGPLTFLGVRSVVDSKASIFVMTKVVAFLERVSTQRSLRGPIKLLSSGWP